MISLLFILNVMHFFSYIGIDLWLEFVEFSIGCMSDSTGTDNVRQLMERALSAGGLHVSKGNVLWEVYNEFEKIILASLKVLQLIENYLLLSNLVN